MCSDAGAVSYENVRRILAILLLLVSASPLVAPLVVQGTEANVAVCCRRGGDHHCMRLALNDKGMSVHARCPAMQGDSLPGHMQTFALAEPEVRGAETMTQPGVLAQVEAKYRISFCRSRQKRGPPTIA